MTGKLLPQRIGNDRNVSREGFPALRAASRLNYLDSMGPNSACVTSQATETDLRQRPRRANRKEKAVSLFRGRRQTQNNACACILYARFVRGWYWRERDAQEAAVLGIAARMATVPLIRRVVRHINPPGIGPVALILVGQVQAKVLHRKRVTLASQLMSIGPKD